VRGLSYDRAADRWVLDGRDLHCSDGFDVRIAGRWVPVRVEYQDRVGWVLYADHDAVRILPGRSLPVRRNEE